MRVIAGRLKGRQLASGGWPGLRPTSDRLRETLFNVLADRVPGARVLDLFAGTGAVGIEALSRGAAHVTFVEASARAADLIASNLARCGLTEGYTIVRAAAERLDRPPDGAPFDLVFLDPPYDHPAPDVALARAASWLAEAGLLVVEHARRREMPTSAGPLDRYRVIRSGDSALSLYARRVESREAGAGARTS